MENILNDKRFKHAVADPRFKNVPRKDRKVKIDKRFQSMFTDKRFQIKYAVDERGREVDELQSESYKKYYDLSESSADSSSESASDNEELSADKDNIVAENLSSLSQDQEENIHKSSKVDSDSSTKECSENEKNKAKDKLKEVNKEVNKYIDEIHKNKLNSKIKDKLSDFRVDYARGIGTLMSESSSDESSSEDDELVNIEHPWGELDHDAEKTDEISCRLAVCNMDWDRVTAKDLLVLFHSFLPPDGVIESVTIYPSEFGIARMAEEELKGPKELVESQGDMFEEESEDEIEEGSLLQREKLREYQLKRLKYYYAVVVCNTPDTANTLYTECDGIEYESSAMKLDLRFIPDDITFDQKPHDVCSALPDLTKYQPRLFINTALQQGKVDLTWDETDPNRMDFSRKLLAGEEVDESDIHTFVAASSSSEAEDEGKEKYVETDKYSDKEEEDKIKKYRDLISSLRDEKDNKQGNFEMEVTWGVDSSNKDIGENTIKKGKVGIVSSSEESEDSEGESEPKKKSKTWKRNKIKSRGNEQSSSENEKQNAELELLLADDNPDETGLKHFSLKQIQKEEKEQNKKRKWRKKLKKNLNYQEEDTFKMDPSDERFSAIFTSHQFNLDPADPHFRKTKGMEQLIAEKQKRRKIN